MGILEKLKQLSKSGGVFQRQQAEAEKRKQAADAERRRKNEEDAKAQALKYQAGVAVVKQKEAEAKVRREEKQSQQVRWGQDKIVLKNPFYVRNPHPYRGARQITFTVGLRDGNIRFDEAGLAWINSHIHSPTIALRCVTARGGMFVQAVPREKLAAVLAEYKGVA